jgi:hypothetical protein
MTITLTPELEAVLTKFAQRQGISAEALVLSTLRQKFLPELPEPRDDWERRLRSIAEDCGGAWSFEDVSSEGLYD